MLLAQDLHEAGVSAPFQPAVAAMGNGQAMRNFEEWQRSLRNFEWLSDVVPGAMDIDVMVERKGHFLIIETKPFMPKVGVYVGYGQHKALYALSKQPNTTVYLIGDDAGTAQRLPRRYLLCYNAMPAPAVIRRNGKPHAYWPVEKFIPTNTEGLQQIVREWWDDASE